MIIVVWFSGCKRAPTRTETHTKSANVSHMTGIYVALCQAAEFRPDLVSSNLVNLAGVAVCTLTNVLQQSVDNETFGRLVFHDTWGNCFLLSSSKLEAHRTNGFGGTTLQVSMWSVGPDGRNDLGTLDDVKYGPYELLLNKRP